MKYRVLVTQTRLYDFEVEARTLAEAHNEAERQYEADTQPCDIDHTTVVGCRTCGEELHGDDGNEEGLPGYCGPCSIPEQQDRDTGRSEEGAVSLRRDPEGLASAFEAVGRIVLTLPVLGPDAFRLGGCL